MSDKIITRDEKTTYVELNGIFGEFSIPSSVYKVKYFSTIANNRKTDSSYHKLLKELKPMRERTNLSQIDDFEFLLQRDLNDYRVSKELVPYLLNNINGISQKEHIAFFPAILCVLAPAGFIDSDTKLDYPKKSVVSPLETSYDGAWVCSYYETENKSPSILGLLKINFSKTHAIVLDGQHRANAFRVVADSFFTAGQPHVYKNIYANNIEYPKIFEADIPVTIIWFETLDDEYEIKPKSISRKLFLDVNQKAKHVNVSRFILLDDSNPSSVLTRFFYSFLAKNYHYDSDKFSLLHSAFDYDENIRSADNMSDLTLTIPEIISYTFDWLFFSSGNYHRLQVYKAIETKRKKIDNIDRYIGNGMHSEYFITYRDLDQVEHKILKSNIDYQKFEHLFIEKFGKYYYDLISSFPLVVEHINATDQIQILRDNHSALSGNEVDAWDHLFKGGDGLLYVFKRLKKENSGYQTTQGALDIEEKFREARVNRINSPSLSERDINKAYDSLRSIAFQVGYIIAFDYFFKEGPHNEVEYATQDFIKRICKYDCETWIYILTEIKDELIGDVDPKSWPAYKNLIIRLIQNENQFYDCEDLINHSPETKIVIKKFLSKCQSHTLDKYRRDLKNTYIEELETTRLLSFVKDSIEETKELFSYIEDFKILQIDFNAICQSELITRCAKR